ncbi:calcium-binding protein [uncultured Tateyamaria sp.]|uniref:calcium-binding protein n=1 Tax=uncultured Tateyamaria sp. TaxID=455651 RepID=UPI00260A0D34|nr:calcium-binding protein [uncultured Tateyamaria sp.]
MSTITQPQLVGTGLSDQIDGTTENDMVTGLAGNDAITGHAGGDLLYGDYANDNLLDGTDGASSFGDYASTGVWQVTALDNGHQQMTQEITTEIGGVYNLNLSLASNFAAGRTDAAVEVLVNGEIVETFTTQSGAFGDHVVQFTALDTNAEITLRSIDGETDGPTIDTSGPAFHYTTSMEIGGEMVDVATFADGQSNFYQVLNGTLHVYDVDTQTYTPAGASGTVNVNALGYNAQNDLLYSIAVSEGVDSRGVEVNRNDLVMLDAEGNSYRIGETPYRSWTGDFDDQGNLWTFQSSMDHIAVVDVDQMDAHGNPVTEVYRLPNDLVGARVYDVAFDAATQCFYGVARPSAEGADTVLLVIDITSGAPEFRTIPVTGTVVDGETLDGVPAMTFGAAIMDADGNLFVGGNSGNHDMNDSTGSSGGIYQVIIDPTTGAATLHLMADAPGSYSNDGAADPTAESPFGPVDLTSSLLLRDISLVATTEGDLSYNDSLSGGAGNDTLDGGIGVDMLVGGSGGDRLEGDSGNDTLDGGAGDGGSNPITSTYDDTGARYDQFGNLLAPDDDILFGGAGDDLLSGSAGHDTIDGGVGDDMLRGGSGNDELHGGEGADNLGGGSEDDLLRGGDGADTLDGGSGNDALNGGAGTDRLIGGSGNDALNGGAGHDELRGSSGADVLNGDAGDDTLGGGSGNDDLNGGAGSDRLIGGSGSDSLNGAADADTLIGGSGNDDLSGGGGRDRLNGGSGDDLLHGEAGHDLLNGSTGDDTLHGGDGNDRLYLGAGDDFASGGAGADRFIFRDRDLDGGSDVISDFNVSQGDSLDLTRLDIDTSSAADWLAAAGQVVDGNDLQIQLDDTTTLTLLDVGSDLEQLYDNILL